MGAQALYVDINELLKIHPRAKDVGQLDREDLAVEYQISKMHPYLLPQIK